MYKTQRSERSLQESAGGTPSAPSWRSSATAGACRGRSGQESQVVLPHGENVPLRDISEVHFKMSLEYKWGAQAGLRSLSPLPHGTHRRHLRDMCKPH